MVNKTLGNRFEQEFCHYLAQNGFWAHNTAQTKAGQPADIIAVRNGRAYLIDCKVCEHDRFTLSRIEENQENAMTLWEMQGNTSGLFALKLGSTGEIFMITLGELLAIRTAGVASLNATDIRLRGVPVNLWAGAA